MGKLTSTYSSGAAAPGAEAAKVRPKGRSAPVGRYKGTSSGISEGQKDAVRIMQRIMGNLESNLQDSTKQEMALNAIKNANNGQAPKGFETKESIGAVVRGFGGTSAGGHSGSYDGIWGRNTKSSLGKVKQFVKSAGLKGILIQEGTGTSPYKEMNDKAVIKAANDNITNLGRLFTSLGLQTPVDVKKRGGSSYVLDEVGPTLTSEGIDTQTPWPNHRGNVPVTVGDLRSLITFLYFIQSLQYTECKLLPSKGERKMASDTIEISKAAEVVLESSIWKESQQSELTSTEEAEKRRVGIGTEGYTGRATGYRSPEKKKIDQSSLPGHCINTIDDFINWFARRSRAVYGQINRAADTASPHPIGGSAVTDQDIKAATGYMSAIRRIAEQWGVYRPAIEDVLRKRGLEDRPVVSYDVLAEALGKRPVSGGGYEAAAVRPGKGRGKGRGKGYTVESPDNGTDPLKGPISSYMRLDILADKYDPDTNIMSRLIDMSAGEGQLPVLDLRSWRSGSWIDIALRNIDAATDVERLRLFPEYAALIRALIQSIYRNWEGEHRAKITRDVSRDQSRKLDQWERYIRAKISQAQRGMTRAIDNVAGREGARPRKKVPFRSGRR